MKKSTKASLLPKNNLTFPGFRLDQLKSIVGTEMGDAQRGVIQDCLRAPTSFTVPLANAKGDSDEITVVRVPTLLGEQSIFRVGDGSHVLATLVHPGNQHKKLKPGESKISPVVTLQALPPVTHELLIRSAMDDDFLPQGAQCRPSATIFSPLNEGIHIVFSIIYYFSNKSR